jgi:hypothetical protein
MSGMVHRQIDQKLSLMTPTPDIQLTEGERELFVQIRFRSNQHEKGCASLMAMAALVESLLKRDAIPEVRLLYFTDPERNPGGRGKSRRDVFKRNGTSGAKILEHPNFIKYFEYFVCGPNLPNEIITVFKKAASVSGYLTEKNVVALIPRARKAVRFAQLDPHKASDEFHKLVLECGGLPSSATSIRNAIRQVKKPR